MENLVKFSKRKAFLLIAVSIATVVVSQLAAFFIGELIVKLGLSKLIGNITTAVLYGALSLLCLYFICKISKNKLSDFGISKLHIKPVWAVSAFLLPLSFIIAMTLLSGTWKISDYNKIESIELIISSVLFFLAVGVVEESVFRGIIMRSVEKISNKYVAVIVPSLLFGILHIDSSYNVLSCLQVIIAGTSVGILFSLVAYESGNIWSGALIHGIWDIAMSGGLLSISVKSDESSVFNYILNSRSFLITGGDFGVEASIFAIAAYSLFSILALLLIIKESKQ